MNASTFSFQKLVSLLKNKNEKKILTILSVCFYLSMILSFSAHGTEILPPVVPLEAPIAPPSPVYPETQIQNLYNPFKEEYKFLSPVMGLLVLNSGMLANLRFKGRYGAERPEYLCHYQITHPAEGHLPTSTVDCPQDHTSALIQHFFPSPAGGLLVPPALNRIDALSRLTINDIGELLKIYVRYTEELNANPELKKEIEGRYGEQFKNFFNKILSSLKNDKQAWNALGEKWVRLGLEELPEKYAEMFLKAAEERDLYPAHIVEYALWAYVWKNPADLSIKISQIKTVINEKLKEFFISRSKGQESPEEPKRGKLSPEEIAALKAEAVLRKEKEKASFFSESLYFALKEQAVKEGGLLPEEFQKWIEEPEKLIFMTLGYDVFENDYPPMLGTGKATYQGVSFSDCGESTLLNFFNIMLANPTSKTFNVNALMAAFPHARESLIKFYQENQPSYTRVVDNATQRSRWAEAISGLNAQKVKYTSQLCNIRGAGIDNMLAVLEEILNDSALISLHEDSIEKMRASKLSYIFEKLNPQIQWVEQMQSAALSAYPKITLLVNNKERFLWTFKEGHFTLLPIQDSSSEKNWLLKGAEAARLILASSLPDDLKGLLLPFYCGESFYKTYENNSELQGYLKKYIYELVFGSKLQGKEQLLASLDHLLTLDPGNADVKKLSRGWIRETFSQRDGDGDRNLTALLFRHRNVFTEGALVEDFGSSIAEVYKENLKQLESSSIESRELLFKYFSDLSPYNEELIIHVLAHWGDQIDIISFIEQNELFHRAAKNGKKKVLEFLLEKFPKFDENPKLFLGRSKDTLLHLAAEEGQAEIVKLFIELKPHFLTDSNLAKNSSGFTPLHSAAIRGHAGVAKLLIEAMPDLLKNKEYAKDGIGNTPLHLAAAEGHTEIVKLLIEVAPDLLKNEGLAKTESGMTPLHLAADEGHAEIVKLLIEAAPTLLTNPKLIKAERGDTSLHLAALKGHEEIVKFIVESAPHLLKNKEFIKEEYGRTPLHLAAWKGYIEIVKFLFEAEPELLKNNEYIKADQGLTPLHFAGLGRHVEIVKFLIETAPDLLKNKEYAKDEKGRTPLHSVALSTYHQRDLLAQQKQIETINLLIEAVPSLLKEKDSAGRYPSDLATRDVRTYMLEQEKLYFPQGSVSSPPPNLNQN